jgi:hypothetical protein
MTVATGVIFVGSMMIWMANLLIFFFLENIQKAFSHLFMIKET